MTNDDGVKSQDAYAVPGFPTYVVIDRKGVVRSNDYKLDHALVEKLLDE